MSSDHRVYILAPVHNRRAITENFIRCLLAQTYCDWHLLLIDDGSKDGTSDMARALVPSEFLTILYGTGSWWWAGSLHQGYVWLKSRRAFPKDLVLIMNDDTEFDPNFIANAVKLIRPRSLMLAQCHAVAGGLEEVGVNWDWSKLLGQGITDPAKINCFSTRGLFLHLEDFLELGGFHPILLPHYLSDYEFTMRAHRRGLAMISSPDVFLRFDDSPSLTGIRTTVGLSILEGMRRNLSVRSTANPVYWSSFAILGSPLRYLLQNLFRIWWRFFAPLRQPVVLFFAPVHRVLAPIRHLLGRVKRKIKREWAAWNSATR